MHSGSRLPSGNGDSQSASISNYQSTSKMLANTQQVQKEQSFPSKDYHLSLQYLVIIIHKKWKQNKMYGLLKLSSNCMTSTNKQQKKKYTVQKINYISKTKILNSKAFFLNQLLKVQSKNKKIVNFCKLLSIVQQRKRRSYINSWFKKCYQKSLKVQIKTLLNQESPVKMIKNQVSRSIRDSRSSDSYSQFQVSSSQKDLRSKSIAQGNNQTKNRVEIQRSDKQLSWYKLMSISQQIKSELIKLQRYDKKMLMNESQKQTKDLLQQQIKRLEKIKSSNRQIKSKIFDSQILSKVLQNHIRLVSQLNLQLSQLSAWKKQKLQKQSKDRLLQKDKSKLKQNLLVQLQANNNLASKQIINNFITKFQNDQSSKYQIYLMNRIRNFLDKQEQIIQQQNRANKFEMAKQRLIKQQFKQRQVIKSQLANKDYPRAKKSIDLFCKKYENDENLAIQRQVYHDVNSLIEENIQLSTILNGKSIQRQLEKMKRQKQELNKSLQKEKSKNEQFLRSHNSLTSKVRELQKSLQSQKSQLSRSNLGSKSIEIIKQHKNVSATSSVNSLSRYIRSDNREQLIQELRTQIAELKRENQDQKSQIGKLNKEITDRNTILKNLSDRLIQLEQQQALLNNETCNTQEELKLQKQAEKQVEIIQNQLRTRNYSFAKKSMEGFNKNYAHLIKFTNQNSLYKFFISILEEIQRLKQIQKQNKICEKNLAEAKKALIREKQLEQALNELKTSFQTQNRPLQEIEDILSKINTQYQKSKNWQRISIKRPSTKISNSIQVIYILLQGCKQLAIENSNIRKNLQNIEKNALKAIQAEKDLNSTVQFLKKCQNIIKKKQYLKDDSVWNRVIEEKKIRRDISSTSMQIISMLLNQGKASWVPQKKKLQETIQKLEADYKISQGKTKKIEQDLKHNRIQIQDLNNIIQQLREKILQKQVQQRQRLKADSQYDSQSTHKRRFSRSSHQKITSSRQQTPRSTAHTTGLMQQYIEQQKKMLEKISELQQKIQQYEGQNMRLKEQLQQNIIGSKMLQQQYMSQMTEIKKKFQNYKASETLKQQLNSLEFKLSITEQELKQAKEKLRISEENFRRKNQQLINLQQQLANKKKDHNRLEQKIQQKDNLLTQSRNVYVIMQKLYEQRQKELAQLKKSAAKIQSQSNNEKRAFEAFRQNYENLNFNLRAKQTQNQQLRASYSNLQQRLINKNQELNQIRNLYSELQKVLIEKSSQIQFLKIEMHNSQSKKKDLTLTHSQFTNNSLEISQYKHSLQHQLTSKVQEINKLKNQVNTKNAELNRMQRRCKQLLDEANNKQYRLSEILKQKLTLENRIQKLQVENKKQKLNAQDSQKELKYLKQNFNFVQNSGNNKNKIIEQLLEKDNKIAQLINQRDLLAQKTNEKIDRALKNQQAQFNQFLKKNDIQRNNYYQNVVFPEWKKAWQLELQQIQPIIQKRQQRTNQNLADYQYRRQLQLEMQSLKIEFKRQKELQINAIIQQKDRQMKKELSAAIEKQRVALERKYNELIQQKVSLKEAQAKKIKQSTITQIEQYYKQLITNLEKKNKEVLKNYANGSQIQGTRNLELIQKCQLLQANYQQLLYEKKSIHNELTQALKEINILKIQIQTVRKQKSQLQTTFQQKTINMENQLRQSYSLEIEKIKNLKQEPHLKEREQIVLLHRIMDNQQVQLEQLRNFVKKIDSNPLKREETTLSNNEDKLLLKIKNMQIDQTKMLFEIKSEYEIKLNGQEKDLQLYKRRCQEAQQKIQFTKRQLQSQHKNLLQEQKLRMTIDFQKKYAQIEANLISKTNEIKYITRENQNLNEEIKYLKQNIIQFKSELNRSQTQIAQLKNKNYQYEYDSKVHYQKQVSLKRQIDMLHYTTQQSKKQYESHLYQLKQSIKQKELLLLNKQEVSPRESSEALNHKTQLENQIFALKQQNKKVKLQLQKMDAIIRQNNYLRTTLEQGRKKSQKQFEQPYIGSAYESNYTNSKRRIKEFYDDYDEAQMQALKRINEEVSDLVQANRKLQLKLSLYENSTQLNTFNSDIINFFLILQNRLEKTLNYLLDNMIIENSDSYKLFLQRSRKYLQTINIEQYFDSFQSLLKNLFKDAHQLQTRQIQSKAKQMMELKEQMSEILEKQIELNEDENNDFSREQKYTGRYNSNEGELLIEVKQLLQQYMQTKDEKILKILHNYLAPIDNL